MSAKPCQTCLGTGTQQNQRERGQQARHFRVVRKLSQKEVAKAMGITAQYLNDLEHGNRGWTYDRWMQMLKATKVR